MDDDPRQAGFRIESWKTIFYFSAFILAAALVYAVVESVGMSRAWKEDPGGVLVYASPIVLALAGLGWWWWRRLPDDSKAAFKDGVAALGALVKLVGLAVAGLAVVGVGLLLLISAWDHFTSSDDESKKGKWVAFYYPDRSNLLRHVQSPVLRTLDECRVWVDATFRARGSRDEYDYECGLDCRREGELNICEKTVR